MLKKILISAAVIAACTASPSMASNMGYYYPSFSAYLPIDPSYEDMQRYIQEYEDYVQGCRDDVDTILQAKQQADSEVEMAISQYNMSHSMY